MISFSLDRVTVTYNAQPVFQELSWDIHNDRCVGLVGANGSGKSTLLRLIAGELKSESGFANARGDIRIGLLHQEPRLHPQNTVWEEALSAAEPLQRLQQRLSQLEADMGSPEVYENPERLNRKIEQHAALLEEHTAMGGAGFEGHLRSILLNLGFEERELELPVTALSGGQKKMVGLARLLVARPDLLLLDEPDNHLDVNGKDFLERYIRNYPGGVVIVSHDRYLLDVVADEIADLDLGRVQVYPGNYSEYAFAKEQNLLQQKHQYDVQQKEITRLEKSAQRLLNWGRSHENEKLIRRGKSMLKRIEKIERIDQPIMERKTMGLELGGWRGSNKVLEIIDLVKSFEDPGGGETAILRGLELTLWHGDRAGLVGPNGAGKSVFFRSVLGHQQPDSGDIKVGPSIKMAYYAQEHDTLDYKASLIDNVRGAARFSEGAAVTFLGRFLYDYEQMRGPVKNLSGGERSRLQLALIMLSGANFLLLDEPTNNLDIRSAEVLEDALEEFVGTVLVISHDRYFLDRVATRIVELEEGTFSDYPGSYGDYQAAKEKQTAATT